MQAERGVFYLKLSIGLTILYICDAPSSWALAWTKSKILLN